MLARLHKGAAKVTGITPSARFKDYRLGTKMEQLHNVHLIMVRMTLQLTPFIAIYLERGTVSALSMTAAWLTQSVRNRKAPR
jgi:hypothetical protein